MEYKEKSNVKQETDGKVLDSNIEGRNEPSDVVRTAKYTKVSKK